jgi:NADPH:quinone reductase-like Zn-dependent oxidoreductase
MFTRSTFETDMIAQHNLLTEISKMVDEGLLRTTFGMEMGPINAKNLKNAHGLIESGRARGEIVLTGFCIARVQLRQPGPDGATTKHWLSLEISQ